MAAVADSFCSERNQLHLIEARYSNCVIVSRTGSCSSLDVHRILIPDEDEQSYYLFLLDRGIPLDSTRTFCKLDEALLRIMKTGTA